MMRTRLDVEAEIMDVVADAQAASLLDDISRYGHDHHRLSDLLTEWQSIPLQRTP